MNRITAFVMVCVLIFGMGAATAAGPHRLGGGAHYWRTMDRIKDDDYKVDDSGVAWLVSYQYVPTFLLRIQTDLEIFPSGFGGFDKTTFAPQAYLVVGSGLYVAGGIGVHYADGKFGDDPFYAVRAGLNVAVLPGLRLDLNANYRFLDWNDVRKLDKKINTDTITLGAAVRMAF